MIAWTLSWERLCKRRVHRNLPFCKDALLEQVLQLKVVAMRSKHEKAVFQPLRGKRLVSDDQFRRYLLVLLGDKEQEKVFDRMSKVDKAFKSSARPERFGEPCGFGQRRPRRTKMEFIWCYAFQGYGHYTQNCRVRSRGGEEQTPEAKRGRWSENRK